jgi:hypothetical protein
MFPGGNVLMLLGTSTMTSVRSLEKYANSSAAAVSTSFVHGLCA